MYINFDGDIVNVILFEFMYEYVLFLYYIRFIMLVKLEGKKGEK